MSYYESLLRTWYLVHCTSCLVPRYFLSRIHVLLRIPTSYLVLGTSYFIPRYFLSRIQVLLQIPYMYQVLGTKYKVQCTKYHVPRLRQAGLLAAGRFLSRIHVLLRISTSYFVLGTSYFIPNTLEIGFNRKPKLLDK
jgi:hypothetical protein